MASFDSCARSLAPGDLLNIADRVTDGQYDEEGTTVTLEQFITILDNILK